MRGEKLYRALAFIDFMPVGGVRIDVEEPKMMIRDDTHARRVKSKKSLLLRAIFWQFKSNELACFPPEEMEAESARIAPTVSLGIDTGWGEHTNREFQGRTR